MFTNIGSTEHPKFATRREAALYLASKGLVYSHDGIGGDTLREYWKRTDDKPDRMFDHSATITVYREQSLVSEFL